jgi:hypothetical protein
LFFCPKVISYSSFYSKMIRSVPSYLKPPQVIWRMELSVHLLK